mmetsp:Transcript_59259/g.184051  ORF Transcript_59259/g.184051 Transcript_59259/m.184051 type:complete len:399 (-) Transcript_59259:1831-3027(-)
MLPDLGLPLWIRRLRGDEAGVGGSWLVLLRRGARPRHLRGLVVVLLERGQLVGARVALPSVFAVLVLLRVLLVLNGLLGLLLVTRPQHEAHEKLLAVRGVLLTCGQKLLRFLLQHSLLVEAVHRHAVRLALVPELMCGEGHPESCVAEVLQELMPFPQVPGRDAVALKGGPELQHVHAVEAVELIVHRHDLQVVDAAHGDALPLVGTTCCVHHQLRKEPLALIRAVALALGGLRVSQRQAELLAVLAQLLQGQELEDHDSPQDLQAGRPIHLVVLGQAALGVGLQQLSIVHGLESLILVDDAGDVLGLWYSMRLEPAHVPGDPLLSQEQLVEELLPLLGLAAEAVHTRLQKVMHVAVLPELHEWKRKPHVHLLRQVQHFLMLHVALHGQASVFLEVCD